MRENEFEKKVQRQMEELQLSPSPSVWTRVEQDLKKKKRRRVVFFILLLAGLGLLGYSGYTLFNSGTTTALVHQDSPLSADSLANTHTLSPAIEDTADHALSGPGTKAPPATGVTAGQTPQYIEANKKSSIVREKKIQTAPGNIITSAAPATGRETAIVTDPATVQPVKEIPMPAKDIIALPPGKEEVTGTGIVENKLPAENHPAVSTENKPAPADSLAEIPAKENTEPAVATPKKTNPKLRFGLDLSAGLTRNRTKSFSLTTSVANDNFNYIGSSQASTGAPIPIRPPSPVKSGPAFKIGVMTELNISAGSSLSAGLRYTYLQEKIQVGIYKDTTIISNSYTSMEKSITGVYRSVPGGTYTNKYHFVELPLFYQLRLNKGHKVPVLWNTGVSAGYLVATNALVYDTAAGGIYYHNKGALNKLQASVHTGFSFRFGNKTGLQWSVGPELSMNLTRLMKQEPFINKRYLLYGGLTARILLPRK
jgi:hypothetical protein